MIVNESIKQTNTEAKAKPSGLQLRVIVKMTFRDPLLLCVGGKCFKQFTFKGVVTLVTAV